MFVIALANFGALELFWEWVLKEVWGYVLFVIILGYALSLYMFGLELEVLKVSFLCLFLTYSSLLLYSLWFLDTYA